MSTSNSTPKALNGQTVGYVRVSTLDQNPARQLEGIELDRTFTEFASGRDTKRPQLEAMVLYVRAGDTLMVHSMDRLARNLDDLRRLVQDLTKRGVKVQFCNENLIFTGDDSPMATLLLSMMGAFAEFERSIIRERQREGIAIARAKGAYKGRPRSLKPEQVEAIRIRAASGESKTLLANEFSVSRETLYACLRA